MLGSTLGLIIELIMALLLVVTISYCFIVNRKLTALRTDQSGLRQVIAELNRSSERAEQAIGEMRRTALSVEGQMANQMEMVRGANEELELNLEKTRELREVARKLSDVDVKVLRTFEKKIHPNAVSDEQLQLAKKLKKQRIGFGKDRFTRPRVSYEADVNQQVKKETA